MEFLIDPQRNAAGKPAGKAGAKPADKAGPGAGADVVKEGTTEGFMTDVIEASAKVPVVVDFWAPWCGPCKQLGPLIERLVRQAGGLVKLVKINVDENQELAAQMRVQSIPAVYAFHGGRPVDGFVGAQPESQVKAFIDRLLGGAKPPLDLALEAAAEALAQGRIEDARAIYAEVLAQEPGHAGASAGSLRAALAAGRLDEARKFADSLGPELKAKSEVAAAITALDLAEEGRKPKADTGALEARLAANAADHEARFALAVARYGADDAEAAIDELLELVRRAPAWNDQAARKQLVKIFDALGPKHELTVAGRRRLSSILFA